MNQFRFKSKQERLLWSRNTGRNSFYRYVTCPLRYISYTISIQKNGAMWWNKCVIHHNFSIQIFRKIFSLFLYLEIYSVSTTQCFKTRQTLSSRVPKSSNIWALNRKHSGLKVRPGMGRFIQQKKTATAAQALTANLRME